MVCGCQVILLNEDVMMMMMMMMMMINIESRSQVNVILVTFTCTFFSITLFYSLLGLL